MMDAGLNTAVGLTGRQRLLNLLHGMYGVGTAIGPLVVTAAILAGSWRPAYLIQVSLDLALAALWLRQRRRERRRDLAQAGTLTAAPAAAGEPHPAAQWSRRRYSGVVVAGHERLLRLHRPGSRAGQWEAELLPRSAEPVHRARPAWPRSATGAR